MAKKEWPAAHIEVYADGRTHLFFENDPQTRDIPAVVMTKEMIKKAVQDGLGDKLQPGRVYRIKITRLSIFRKTIEFDYDRVR